MTPLISGCKVILMFKDCQGLAKLACVEAVFPNTIWNGLLAVEVFPKCVYLRTVDSQITVFTMYVFCCIFAMVFHLYFVVLRELVGAVT